MPEQQDPSDVSRSMFNPYPGLRAFEPGESYLYFGRERQTDDLMRRLRGAHFLAVVGTSGSGKSSLVRAGLVPALHGGFMARAGSSWRVAILRPGGQPIQNLADALADPEVLGGGDDDEIGTAFVETTLRGSSLGLAEYVALARIPEHDNVLVVVDQFEELFRYKRDERGSGRDEAVAFVKLLLAAAEQAGQIYVVITMRSDFIGDCMEFPRLPEAINEGQYLVPRMTRDELRLAITGPAGVRQAKISPRLVARLLNDVGDNPDHLPVLQHALMQMWTVWEGTDSGAPLDLDHYREIGTMEKALSRHVEKAYAELQTGRQREIAKRMFQTLTDTEREGRGVRRPARLGEIAEVAGASIDEVIRVINRFRLPGRSFLMPPYTARLAADSIIDLSHESLMRNWDRLVEWIEEEADSADMYQRLSDAARLHEAGQAGLWRSPELDLGLRWREETRPTAVWARRYDPEFDRAIAFLDKSVRERDAHLARQEQARRRKLRAWAGVAAALVLMLAGFLWYVANENDRQRALSVSLAGEDPLLRAQVLSEIPPRLEDRVARFFGRWTDRAGGLEFEALRRAAYDPIPRAVFRAPIGTDDARTPLTAAAVSPDGRWVAIGAADGNAWIWPSDGGSDAITLATAGNVKAHSNQVTGIAFDPGGDRILTASADGTATIWAPDGTRLSGLAEHRGEVLSAAWSPGGDRVVTGSSDATARIWNGDGQTLQTLLHDAGQTVTSAAFDDTGTRVVTMAIGARPDQNAARIWDLESGRGRALDGNGEPTTGAWFVPGGREVLIASIDGGMALVDLQGGPVFAFEGHALPARGVVFSPDGASALSFADDARIWSLENGERRAVLSRETGISSAAFAPDGRHVVTASTNGVARLWKPGGESLRELRGHVGPIAVAAFSPSTPIVVTAAADGTARVWPLASGEPRLLGQYDGEVTAIAPSPATAGADTSAVVATSGAATVFTFSSEDQDPAAAAALAGGGTAAFSPAGDEIVLGDGATARVWRRETPGGWVDAGEPLEGHEAAVTAVAYHPADGDEIVTASLDGTARVWTRGGAGWRGRVLAGPAPEGSASGSGKTHDGRVASVAFSPDGTKIVTASWDQAAPARVWIREAAGWRLGSELRGGHKEYLNGAAFGPAGERIVMHSTDAATIWTPDGEGTWTLKNKHRLEGHHGQIYSASFSPGGGEAVTASEDGTIRAWDTETGSGLYVLEVGKPVRVVRFHPDGRHLLAGLGDGSVQLWRVALDPLRRYLERSSSACLTVEQRCHFLNERERTARARFAECERARGRTPPAELGTCP